MAGGRTEAKLVVKLQAQTSQLTKDLAKAQRRLKRFQGGMNKIGSSIRTTMLGMFGGAVILQGITNAVKSLAEFELVMDKVNATSGASASQMKLLTENALNLGRTTKFTAGEIGNLQLELSKLGFSTSKILATTAAVTKLAKVTDEDLGESAKTLAGSLNSFNLEASQSERVANLMAESFTKSALTLEKFTVGTANSGASANAWGVSIEMNTARLAKLVDANIDASKAGTDLRKIYMELNKTGMTYDEALTTVAGSTNKLSAAQDLVGVRAAGALLILTQQSKAVKDLNGEFTDANKEIDKQADIVSDNLVTSWALFKSAIDGVVQKGTPLRDLLKGLLDDVTKLFKAMTPKDIQARNEAFARWGRVMSKFGDNEHSLSALEKAFSKLTTELDASDKALQDWKDNNTNFEGEILAQGGNLDDLKKEYERLQIARAEIVGKSQAFTARMDAITDSIAAQAKAQKELNDASERGQQSIESLTRKGGSKFEGEDAPDLMNTPELPKALDSAQAVLDSMKMLREGMSNEALAIEALMEGLGDNLRGILANIAVDIISGFAEALGSGASLKDAFKGVLSTMGEGLKSIGKSLIAYGVMMIALQKTLKAGILANPFVAIAAGAAAVAAGAALKSAVSSTSSSMASGGSGGGSRGSFSADRSGQSVNVNIQGRLEADGRSLVAVFDQQVRSDSRNR